MARRINLSASSISTFLRCGYQWYLAYVEGVRAAPSFAAARGIAVHRAVEVNLSQKVTSKVDLPVDDMLDAFSESWDALEAEGLQPDEEKDPGEIKDGGYKLTALHHKEVSPLIQPVWVERPVQFEINGVVYSGQIDAADEMGRIRDTKTTGSRPKPDYYTNAMTGYALSARQLTGQMEQDVVLDFLVGTKVPYYQPVSNGGPVTDDDIDRFALTVEAVAEGIEQGNFIPNGLQGFGVCQSMCGYNDICPYYKKR